MEPRKKKFNAFPKRVTIGARGPCPQATSLSLVKCTAENQPSRSDRPVHTGRPGRQQASQARQQQQQQKKMMMMEEDDEKKENDE